ncbi:hypothetical protein GCM10027591_13100 [Zhihengliuella somnathii]
MMGEFEFRGLRPADRSLLRVATHANMNWRGREAFTYRDLDTQSHFNHYFQFRPRRGDFGLAAESGGHVAGVVWCLFLDSANPGYGYVSDDVPELSLCVWSGYRGQGLGRRLLDGALELAREAGVERISLSVEEQNTTALRLYRSAGFRRAPEALDAGTHVIDLTGR